MARIETALPVRSISGKFRRADDIVFSVRNGQTFACQTTAYRDPWSEAQQAVHTRFKTVMALVLADMADPTKKKEWQDKADASGGKYSTARGIAFAHYWAAEEESGL